MHSRMLQQLASITTKIHSYHFWKVMVIRGVFILLEKGKCDTTIEEGKENLGIYRLHCLRVLEKLCGKSSSKSFSDT